jgi:hypothetical protein
VIIFAAAFIYARMHGPVEDAELEDDDDEKINSSRRA